MNTYPESNYLNDFNFVDGFIRPQTKEEIAEGISPGIADQIIENTPIIEKHQKDVIIHTGPNISQFLEVKLFNLRAATLHVKELEVDTYEHAMQSLRRVDQAQAQLTQYRTYYGALQNRLGHSQVQVEKANEQMVRSLDFIESQDYSESIQELSKEKVLLQSILALSPQIKSLQERILDVLK